MTWTHFVIAMICGRTPEEADNCGGPTWFDWMLILQFTDLIRELLLQLPQVYLPLRISLHLSIAQKCVDYFNEKSSHLNCDRLKLFERLDLYRCYTDWSSPSSKYITILEYVNLLISFVFLDFICELILGNIIDRGNVINHCVQWAPSYFWYDTTKLIWFIFFSNIDMFCL